MWSEHCFCPALHVRAGACVRVLIAAQCCREGLTRHDGRLSYGRRSCARRTAARLVGARAPRASMKLSSARIGPLPKHTFLY
jgi:hypothetical protein